MDLSKEEKIKIILNRITTTIVSGGSSGYIEREVIVSPKKLAEFLLENID